MLLSKNLFFWFNILLLGWNSVNATFPSPTPHDPVKAVSDLIQRRIPKSANQFALEIIPSTSNSFETFEIEQVNEKIHLRGSTGVALASALNWYLKYYCNAQLTWNADNLKHISSILPSVPEKFQMTRQSKYTYYQNVCTVSYSMWSWDWKKWEHHIDWMALNGINLPLAFTGQEKVWHQTFTKHLNVSKEGMNKFFSGAAFLAWNRMGNVQGNWISGSLPEKFIEDQYQMQLKILDRMKEFGMIPVLPGFAGHIPEEVHDLYPEAKVTKSPKWGGFKDQFTRVMVVEPSDPLFAKISKHFIEEQTLLYNYTSSIYQMDTYNELNPTSTDLTYLKSSSKSVYEGMKAADPKGIWLMQGWLFLEKGFWISERIEAYLSGVPNEGMVILDLYSEAVPIYKVTNNYYGKSWIYCLLHNFGGTVGMHGDLPTIGNEIIDASLSSNNTMIGIGLTMEGIFQNYVVYELMLEMTWRNKKVDVHQWLETFADHRYGQVHESTRKAWKVLGSSVYNCSHCSGGVPKAIFERRPQLPNLQNKDDYKTDIYRGGLLIGEYHHSYNSETVLQAWENLLKAANDFHSVETYQYDLVDVTRQAISDAIRAKTNELHEALKNKENMCSIGSEILNMMEDLEWILESTSQFLLGKWIEDARKLGDTLEDKKYYEYQARNQVTRWGDDNGNALNDYASKQWAGLILGYYYQRWNIFLDHLCSQYNAKQDINMTLVHDKIEKFEVAWQIGLEKYTTEEIGDTVFISKTLFHKYSRQFKNKSDGDSSTQTERKNGIKCGSSKEKVFYSLNEPSECVF